MITNLINGNTTIPRIVNNSIQRLTRKNIYFSNYNNIEEWMYNENEKVVDNECRYMAHIKQFIIRKYQSKDIYISPTALDDIIFYSIQNFSATDLLDEIDKLIVKSGLNRNSVVIVPLHSFGFKALGTRHLFRNFLDVYYEHDNFRIFPQTNSFEKTRKLILKYLDDISLPNRKKLDVDLFEHFYKSRSLKWLEHNPFMIMHFKFSQQERFDNVRFILEKIEFITNKIYFIYALSNNNNSNRSSLFSTKNTNNWETLDIYHFLTISTRTGSADLNCLPVHFSTLWIFDIIHMNIDMNYKFNKGHKWYVEAISSIDTIYLGYMKYKLNKETKDLKFYRIANSLKYFRRSIKAISDEDKIINLDTALEVLLIDDFENQKKKKMLERLWKVLKRKRQLKMKDIYTKVSDLIDERNNIIHGGVLGGIGLDFNYLNSLYCRFILNLVNDIKKIDSCKVRYLSNYYDSL